MIYNCQIVYHRGNCIDSKRPFVNMCRLCMENCPQEAISIFHELDTRRCTECGVCSAVCPSDGFVYFKSDKLHAYIRNSKKVVLNCPQAILAGHEIPCLGIIDRDLWMTLMMYAGEKEVTIFTGLCAECPDKKACKISVQTFNEVHNNWKDHPPIGIKVAPDKGNGELASKETVHAQSQIQSQNRGQMENRGWRSVAREKVQEALPGITSDETYLIPRTRQFFEETWKSRTSQMKLLPIPALKVSDSCTHCGDCTEVCPQGALMKKENQESDQFTLIYEPKKCARCQRCVSICRSKAIRMEMKDLSYRVFNGKVVLEEDPSLRSG